MRHIRLEPQHLWPSLLPPADPACASTHACPPSRSPPPPPTVSPCPSAISHASLNVRNDRLTSPPPGSPPNPPPPAAESIRITPYFRTPSSTQLLPNPAGLPHLCQEPFLLLSRPHRRPAPRSPPTPEPPSTPPSVPRSSNLTRQLLQPLIVRVNIRMRQRQEYRSTPSNLNPIHTAPPLSGPASCPAQ